MDKTNLNEDVFVLGNAALSTAGNYSELSEAACKDYGQFCKNSITLANNWLGSSGDYFLFAANTIAAYLIAAQNFYEANSDLLSDYVQIFSDVDTELQNSVNSEISEG